MTSLKIVATNWDCQHFALRLTLKIKVDEFCMNVFAIFFLKCPPRVLQIGKKKSLWGGGDGRTYRHLLANVVSLLIHSGGGIL